MDAKLNEKKKQINNNTYKLNAHFFRFDLSFFSLCACLLFSCVYLSFLFVSLYKLFFFSFLSTHSTTSIVFCIYIRHNSFTFPADLLRVPNKLYNTEFNWLLQYRNKRLNAKKSGHKTLSSFTFQKEHVHAIRFIFLSLTHSL